MLEDVDWPWVEVSKSEVSLVVATLMLGTIEELLFEALVLLEALGLVMVLEMDLAALSLTGRGSAFEFPRCLLLVVAE